MKMYQKKVTKKKAPGERTKRGTTKTTELAMKKAKTKTKKKIAKRTTNR